jgi:hypothetical protein
LTSSDQAEEAGVHITGRRTFPMSAAAFPEATGTAVTLITLPPDLIRSLLNFEIRGVSKASASGEITY